MKLNREQSSCSHRLPIVGKSIQPRGANRVRHGSPASGLVFFDDISRPCLRMSVLRTPISDMALKQAEAPYNSLLAVHAHAEHAYFPRGPSAQGIEARKAYKTATEGMWNKPGFSYSLIDRLSLEAEATC